MHPSLRRFTFLVLAAAFLACCAVGCQTTKGFGKDVEKLGDKIQDKAS
jgi:predicted small secreted protein